MFIKEKCIVQQILLNESKQFITNRKGNLFYYKAIKRMVGTLINSI